MNSMSSATLRKSSLTLAVVAAICSAGAIGAASAVTAGSSALATVAHTTVLHPGDAFVGTLAQSQPIHIEVALKMRDRAGLDAFITNAGKNRIGGVSQPMSRETFMANHAPTQVAAQTVANYLTNMGYKNVVISANRMLVSADGTAATAQRAFLTSFAQVKTHDGRNAFANTAEVRIPAALQDKILSVIGLQTVHQYHTFAKILPPGAHTNAVTGHNPTEFSSIYGATGVATAAGVTVGIITQGAISQTITDLNSFTAAHGFPTVITQTVNTNGTSADASGVGEWNLDSQDVVGMGGGQVGKIIFYNIPTLSNPDLTADINTVVTANATKIINMSLGECETSAQGDGSAAADDQLFATGVSQGQTFSISTGDSGSNECGTGPTAPSSPANSQYVIAAAGTTLNASTTTWSGETVWSGSGGSQSLYEPKPSWQTLWSGPRRGVADIAFDADPNSGSLVIVNGATQQIGGTSLSAPIFAGMWARVIAVKGTGVGFAGPLIYQLPASDFHDVTVGNNGGSTAAVGYDLASGRGSIILSTAIGHIGGGGGSNPVANFTSTTNGLTATFTDSSTDSGGTINAHAWTFGDGATSTATSPSHTYAAAGTYSVSDKVTDNLGATNTKTASVTVAPTGGNVLQNGVAVTGLSATTGNALNYTMVVPSGATGLSFVQSGGTGDSDMYIKFGSAPTDTVYDCRPYVNGNAETCNIATAQAGTYFVRLKAFASYTGVSIKGSYTAGGGGTQTYTNSTPTAIPDVSTVTSTINVSGRTGNASATSQIAVNISHTYRGDLKIDLLSPDGTVFPLKASSGSDSAANVIATYTANLSAKALNGAWVLRIQDTAAGDVGTLNNWSLTF